MFDWWEQLKQYIDNLSNLKINHLILNCKAQIIYQLFLMYSFSEKPRVRQCKHCGEYFIVKDKRKKYCDKKVNCRE